MFCRHRLKSRSSRQDPQRENNRQLAARLKDDNDIASVEYPQEWVERVELVSARGRVGKMDFGRRVVLGDFVYCSEYGQAGALCAQRRSRDHATRRRIGEELIQAPFVLEGMIQGLIGAGVSLAALWGVYSLLQDHMPTIGFFLGTLRAIAIFGSASHRPARCHRLALGLAGSLFSLRRFIKTWHPSSAKF